MKCSGKLACGSQMWGWGTVLRVNCMFWLTSPPDIWLPQLSLNSSPTPLLSHMRRALEQTGANLPGKIRMKILLIDILAPIFLQPSDLETVLRSQRLNPACSHTGIMFPVLTWAGELKLFLSSPITCDSLSQACSMTTRINPWNTAVEQQHSSQPTTSEFLNKKLINANFFTITFVEPK